MSTKTDSVPDLCVLLYNEKGAFKNEMKALG